MATLPSASPQAAVMSMSAVGRSPVTRVQLAASSTPDDNMSNMVATPQNSCVCRFGLFGQKSPSALWCGDTQCFSQWRG